jgi:hypothetical protein
LLVRHDVASAREKLNFSEWSGDSKHPSRNQLLEICDAISNGSMPPWRYRIMHSDARLSSDDVAAVCDTADTLPRQRTQSAAN